MVRSFNAKTRKSLNKIIFCVLLAVAFALTMCVLGVSFTSANAATSVVSGQTVDSNGFRLTYSAQGIDRTTGGLYDDTMDDLTSRVTLTNVVGVDNWGKPIDFSRRFRVHVSADFEDKESANVGRTWMVFDIASTTDAANVNAVQGYATMPAVNTDTIQANSIVHFTSNHGGKRVPVDLWDKHIIWNENAKGFAADNSNGELKVGWLDYGAERREYIYTFDFVSGDNAGERSTLTASAKTKQYGSAGSDVFYLTDTLKTLTGSNGKLKKGYLSLNFNNEHYDLYVKLVHENTLNITTKHGFSVSEIKTFNCGYDTDVTVSSSPKIWGGDLVKIQVAGTDAETNAVLKVGNKSVLAENGYWSFYMPDEDTDITIESNTDIYYRVAFDTDGGSSVQTQNIKEGEKATKPGDPTKTGYVFGGWYTDEACTTAYDFNATVNAAVTLHAKWTALHAVTYKIAGFADLVANVVDGETAPEKTMGNGVRPAGVSNERLPGWTADNLSLTWYSDAAFTQEFDFTQAITAATTVYGKLIETKQYKNPNYYGWDNLTNFTDDSGTQIIQSTHYAKPLFTDDDGTSTFNLTAQQEAVYSRALDVTKDIYYNLALTSEGAGNWFISALWDNLTLAQIAYSDNYQHTYGIKTSFGVDSTTGNNLGAADLNMGSALSGTVNTEAGVKLKYSIKENAADSAIYIWNTATSEWNKLDGLGLAQSDFIGGKAYFSIASFVGCEATVKIWQDIAESDITKQVEGEGTVNVTVIGNGSALKIVTAPGENYELEALTVNGVEAKLSNKGLLAFDSYADFIDGITVSATFTTDYVPDTSVSSVTIGNKPTGEIKVDDTFTLSATVSGGEECDKTVTWTSSNNDVATVDATGKVTAKAAGTATITATSNGDASKKATYAVTVKAKGTDTPDDPDDPNKNPDDPNKNPDDPNKNPDDPNKDPDNTDTDKNDPNKNDKGCGCGSVAGGFGALGASVAVLCGAAVLFMVRRKKTND